MRELGYIEGQNVIIERRYGEGRLDRLPGLARELVDLRVDVIVAIASAAVRAAMSVTTTIPIVMFVNVDPVAVGLVASLSRPGGNVTGVLIAPDGTLAGKKLELLREVVPRASRIAFLAPSDSGVRPQIQEVRNAAVPLGVNLSVVEVQGGEYERAFAPVSRGQAGALFVAAHPFFIGIASSSSSLPPSTACQRCTSGPNTSRRAA